MQKIFRKYIIIIMSISLASVLLINFFLSTDSLQARTLETFNLKINQVIQTIENNRTELVSLKSSLDEDYLTRAKAFAYVIEKNPNIIESVTELQNLATLLDVDELHVSDSEGLIAYSSVPKYIGLDFHNGEQMRGFLPILESDDPDEYVIQDAQPNTAEGKIMKYVGVARKDKKGLVQVGLEPTRLLEAQQRNTYSYIFSRFPTNEGEQLFAINKTTNELIASTNDLNDKEASYYTYDNLKDCQSGTFKDIGNKTENFFVTREYDNILIGATVPKDILYKNRSSDLLLIGAYLIAIEIVIVVSINVILNKKVLKGIHSVLNDLNRIKNGDLNTVVKADDNQELIDLSSGINSMVNSVVNSADRISKIISIIDIPLAAFEYQNDTKQLFATARLKELLHLSDEEANQMYLDPKQLLKKLQIIISNPIEGESDVYCLEKNTFIKIRLVKDENGFYGTVNDVSSDILKKKQIQYEKDHDHLTGLLLYPSFKREVTLVINNNNYNHLYAAVMVDLDSFKHINDTYGHDFGDHYLKRLTYALNKLSKSNCLIARRSGDEFCLFIYNYQDKNTIINQLNKLWSYFKEELIELPDHSYQSIKVSGGFVCSSGPNNTIEELMKKSDKALYEAKNHYKGHFIEYKGK